MVVIFLSPILFDAYAEISDMILMPGIFPNNGINSGKKSLISFVSSHTQLSRTRCTLFSFFVVFILNFIKKPLLFMDVAKNSFSLTLSSRICP